MKKSLKKIAAKEEKRRKHLAAVERVRIATAKVFGYPYISISEHDELNQPGGFQSPAIPPDHEEKMEMFYLRHKAGTPAPPASGHGSRPPEDGPWNDHII
jgi:hypothetical protein